MEYMLIQPQPSVRPKWNDMWATALFIIHLVGFAVIAYFALRTAHSDPENGWLTPDQQAYLVIDLLIVAAFSTGCGVLYTLMMYRFAKTLIYVSAVFCVFLYIFFAVYCFWQVSIYSGVIFLVCGFLQVLFFFAFRSRIPFAALMLSTIVSIMWKFPSIFLASFLVILVQVGWTVLFIFVVTYSTGVWTEWALYGIFVYLFFSYYWTSQVIKNVQHVTASGLFATYFFFVGSPDFPKNPVAGSFSRAMTFSFGSICFGSLLVALIKTVRFVLRSLINNQYLRCFVDCILGCIDSMLRWVTHYAYVEVAIYGKNFCEAGKDTLSLLSRAGFDVIVNDDLIGNVLMMGVFFVSLASFGIAYGIYYAFAASSGIYLLVGFAGLFVG